MPDPLVQYEDFTNAIVACGNILVREAARLFRPYGITPAQFNVLNLLRIYGDGQRPSDIAQRLVVDPASATYLMNQVQEKGWIDRVEDKEDRRASRVSLTAEGRVKVQEMLPLYEQGLASLAKLMGDGSALAEALALVNNLAVCVVEATEAVTSATPPPKKVPKPAKRAKSASR